MNKYIDHLLYILRGGEPDLSIMAKDGPASATILIESRCNLRCLMCFYHSLESPQTWPNYRISFQDFKRVADVLLAHGLKHLNICATGEPFFNPDIFKMIDYASKRAECSILSNGSIAISDKLDAIIASGLKIFKTDMDGGDPATYEFIKRGASWNTLISNLKYLTRHRRNMEIHIDCIAMKSNYKTIPGVIETCLSLGIDMLHLSYLVPFGGSGILSYDNVIKPNDFRIINEINQVVEKGRARGLKISVPAMYRPGKSICRALWNKLMINLPSMGIPQNDWLGNATLQCKLTFDGLSFGNILKQPFNEIWNGKPIQGLREKFVAGDYPEVCKHDCPNNCV